LTTIAARRNAKNVDIGELNMSSIISAISGTAASRIEWPCRLIHTLARGHVTGRGALCSAFSVTVMSSIIKKYLCAFYLVMLLVLYGRIKKRIILLSRRGSLCRECQTAPLQNKRAPVQLQRCSLSSKA